VEEKRKDFLKKIDQSKKLWSIFFLFSGKREIDTRILVFYR